MVSVSAGLPQLIKKHNVLRLPSSMEWLGLSHLSQRACYSFADLRTQNVERWPSTALGVLHGAGPDGEKSQADPVLRTPGGRRSCLGGSSGGLGD